MKRKRRKRGDSLGAEFWERHERTQAILAERIAYHERRKADERRASDDKSSQ
jgi:hypothetical protein